MNSREIRRHVHAVERDTVPLHPITLADLAHHDDDFGEPDSAPLASTPKVAGHNSKNEQGFLVSEIGFVSQYGPDAPKM